MVPFSKNGVAKVTGSSNLPLSANSHQLPKGPPAGRAFLAFGAATHRCALHHEGMRGQRGSGPFRSKRDSPARSLKPVSDETTTADCRPLALFLRLRPFLRCVFGFGVSDGRGGGARRAGGPQLY